MADQAIGARPDIRAFADIFNASPIGIVVESLDGQPVFANPAFCSFLGFNEDELCNKHCVQFSPPEDAQKDWALFAQLRAGQIDHYQLEKRYFRKDGSLVWGRLSLSLLRTDSSPLILAMVEDITDKKAAEEALRESEQRFRLMANQAPMMVWMSGVDKRPVYFNQTWLDFTGRSLETELHSGLREITHPDDFERCRTSYYEAFASRRPFTKECRVRRQDGEYRWVLDTGVPRFLPDGSFAGYIGCCIDITDHKRAEEVLSNVSRQLIGAQEQERARIGRELHDDINQRLALFSARLEQLREDPSGFGNDLPELIDTINQLSADVQSLSHDLHAAKLEYLGALAGMKSWCRDTAERRKIKIDFTSDLTGALPIELGLVLFRVLQEALNNSIKYSETKQVEVRLREHPGGIQFSVCDFGKGFDVEAALQGKGLGLTSMRERVRLVNGTFSIHSKPMAGTTIQVCVPLVSGHSSERAAV